MALTVLVPPSQVVEAGRGAEQGGGADAEGGTGGSIDGMRMDEAGQVSIGPRGLACATDDHCDVPDAGLGFRV